ncbi:MAG: 6-bladed beta-propeller [Bacteroidales bacterium]|nr:6-bladed beta-propeller [Bacteroidales bacterium]
MRKFKIVFFVIIIFLSGCKFNNNPTRTVLPQKCDSINLDFENPETLSFTLDKLVPLETDKHTYDEDANRSVVPLIGKVMTCLCTDDRLFVLNRMTSSYSQLCVYDKNGKFLWATKRGKGPGEIIQAGLIRVSPSGEKVCILQASKYLIEYSKNGDFIQSIKLPSSITEFSYFTETKWIVRPSLWTNKECLIYVFDGKNLLPLPIKNKLNINSGSYAGQFNMQMTNSGELLFKDYLSDTLYEISENSINPKYYFSFNPRGISNYDMSKVYNSEVPVNTLVDAGFPFQREWFAKLGNRLFFESCYNFSRHISMYDFDLQMFFTCRWDDLTVLGVPYNDSRFVGYSSSSIILAMEPDAVFVLLNSGELDHLHFDEESLKALRNLNPLSNPVLVFAH